MLAKAEGFFGPKKFRIIKPAETAAGCGILTAASTVLSWLCAEYFKVIRHTTPEETPFSEAIFTGLGIPVFAAFAFVCLYFAVFYFGKFVNEYHTQHLAEEDEELEYLITLPV